MATNITLNDTTISGISIADSWFNEHFREPEERPLVFLYGVKFFALLSLLASSTIILEVMHDIRLKRSNAVSRLLLSMCVGEIFYSTSWFMSSWLSPSDLTYLNGTNHGNYETCIAQGFLTQFGGASSIFFNASLGAFYLLTVKYNWQEARLVSLEKWVQPSLWLLALTLAIIPLPFDMYNNSGPVCYINSSPLDCLETWELPEDIPGLATNCEKGDGSAIVRFALALFPIWGCVFLESIFMWTIFKEIRKLELKNLRYGVSTLNLDPSGSSDLGARQTEQQQFRQSRMVAKQGAFYIASFLLAYVVYTINGFFLLAGKRIPVLRYTSCFLLTLQGLLLLLVFSRRRNMQSRIGRNIRWLLFQSYVWSLSRQSESSDSRNTGEGRHRRGPITPITSAEEEECQGPQLPKDSEDSVATITMVDDEQRRRAPPKDLEDCEMTIKNDNN